MTGLAHLINVAQPAFGCSVVYYPPNTTVTGHGYLSRNYDFFVGSMADLMMVPHPPDAEPAPAVMSKPHLMQRHREDGGYASLALTPTTPSPAHSTASTVPPWWSHRWLTRRGCRRSERAGNPTSARHRSSGYPSPRSCAVAGHLRDRVRSRAGAADRQAVLPVHAVSLHRRRSHRPLVRL